MEPCWHRCTQLCMRRVNLDTLYAGGARKIIVWGFVAVEQVPIVQLVNKYVNVLDRFFGGEPKDSTVQYGTKVAVRHPLSYDGIWPACAPFTLPAPHIDQCIMYWLHPETSSIICHAAAL